MSPGSLWIGQHGPQVAERGHRGAATGTSFSLGPAGQCSVPLVYGHNWARLRNSVVFPVPDFAGDHQGVAGTQPQVDRIDELGAVRLADLDVVEL